MEKGIENKVWYQNSSKIKKSIRDQLSGSETSIESIDSLKLNVK